MISERVQEQDVKQTITTSEPGIQTNRGLKEMSGQGNVEDIPYPQIPINMDINYQVI